MEIRVLFSGSLSGIAGTRTKTYTGVSSFEDLKLRLFDDFPEIQHHQFRICRRSELIEDETTLNDHDEIILLPYGINL